MSYWYRTKVKRAIDLTGAGIAIIITSPIQLSASLAIWIKMGSPVIFRQERAGYRGKMFTIVKFRTMKLPTGTQGETDFDSERLTSLGRLLRATSIDELPELWNVLRGEMSLVGPRPLLTEYLDRYTTEEARRHEVLPGITGWSQIHGRNDISWDRRMELDVWYVDHVSLLLDLSILIKTVTMVLKRSGISAQGHETMPKFRSPD